MALSSKEIKEILAILEESGWDEAQVTIDDVTLSVSKNGAPLPPPPAASPPASAPAPAAAPAPASEPTSPPAAANGAGDGGHLVASPSVGVFWRAPEPGALPFVEVGDTVEEGQTLCIVEVMKLMQHVTAQVSGVVSAVHAENSDSVEFETPLFSIAPAG